MPQTVENTRDPLYLLMRIKRMTSRVAPVRLSATFLARCRTSA